MLGLSQALDGGELRTKSRCGQRDLSELLGGRTLGVPGKERGLSSALRRSDGGEAIGDDSGDGGS